MKSMVAVSQELQNRIAHRVADCRDILSDHFDIVLTTPEISYKLRGRVGGRAYTKFTHNASVEHQILKVNSVIYTENVDDYLEHCVGHEFAHLAVYQIFGRYDSFGNKIKPHGREWKACMRALGLEPSVTHSYDTSNARVFRKNTKRHIYACNCQSYELTTQKHNKSESGKSIFSCRKCKVALSYTGKTKVFS
jgi:SprT protein